MSIDLNWENLTTGPDGLALASSIRDFIHTKFQSVPLPRFIKSVTVHDFQFGSVPPELELKDITDPLPDFYEEPGSSDEDEDDDDDGEGDDEVPDGLKAAAERRRRAAGGGTGSSSAAAASATPPPGRIPNHHPHPSHIHIPGLRSDIRSSSPVPSPFLGSSTPGIPGGTSNLHYFHSQFATGALSGTQTPLLAATGGHLFAGSDMHHSASSPELAHPPPGHPPARGHGRNTSISSAISGLGPDDPSSTSPSLPSHHLLREKHSVSTLAPTSAGTSRPPTRDELSPTTKPSVDQEPQPSSSSSSRTKPRRTPAIEDLQAVFRIRYAGDVRLLLTADILLDYPMPSFVGIPLRLSITGLTFDGVGVLAKIRKRAHFCFLSPEDALAAVGGEENLAMGEEGEEEKEKKRKGGGAAAAGGEKGKIGGLLQEIRVESEIGQREGGKTSLKNVGKVERFVLEQVRRIFEEEFVYPSFWTFLI